MSSLCHRTLRRQVTAYVPFTRRHAMVEDFTPSESEDRLYQLVSDYLQRTNLRALPASQRALMTLVLRKLLASSSFAIAGALETMSSRLKTQLASQPSVDSLEDQLDDDYEALDSTAEEWGSENGSDPPLSSGDIEAIRQEIADLESFRDLAVSITANAKGVALLQALGKAFEQADRLGALRKAIIFTESRRTQEYLCRVLEDSPYRDGVVMFNGSNNDEKSREIYKEWARRHAGTDRITGSRTADMRSALVDYFREIGQIMIATEAGAEGINLQFCSMVVNYDLPWNPQRIEQRIGRCHRYGQQHNVVVVNFVNRDNEADFRVFKLLSKKFRLFEGVFGASDEVLGAIESGVDFEKRIAEIYQRCRSPQDIKASFDQLQLELSSQINDAMTRTRRQLLENFDQEVHDKLRVSMEHGKEYLDRYERLLMKVTQFELDGHAQFLDGEHGFHLQNNPFAEAGVIPTGLYELPRRSGEAHYYRLQHPLAHAILKRARERNLPVTEIRDLSDEAPDPQLATEIKSQTIVIQRRVSHRNAELFEVEADKLERWADDLKLTLERDIRELERQIKEAKRSASLALSLEEKLSGQKQIKTLEAQRNQKRRSLFDAQDKVDERREKLIAELEAKLAQKTHVTEILSIKWRLT
ncbi:MAG: helicase-related protein [Pirellulaceae bacterium]|nr:helicase-related protein [Pirellulaceae bacterium]